MRKLVLDESKACELEDNSDGESAEWADEFMEEIKLSLENNSPVRVVAFVVYDDEYAENLLQYAEAPSAIFNITLDEIS